MRLLKVCLVLALSAGIILAASPRLYADETSEAILRLLIKKGIVSEREVSEIKAEVAREKVRVPVGLEERVGKLEKEKGFLSNKGVKVDVKGGIELEFVDVQDDNSLLDAATTTAAERTSTEQRPHMKVDKATLRFTVTSEDETIGASTELEMDEGETAFFDDAYVFIKGLELGETTHGFSAGLQNRWIEPKKVFESYPIAGFSYWEDEEYSLIYAGEWDWLYWKASAANGLNLDDKGITEDDAPFEILHDDRVTNEITTDMGSIEWGAGAGVKLETEELGDLNVIGFYLGQKLQPADVTRLNALPGYNSQNTDQYRAGVNADYKLKNFGVRGQYISSVDGELDRWAAHVEPYYTFKTDYRYLQSITPAVQLSWYDVDLNNNTTDARTWDREKYTFGAVCQINKNLKWKNEYSINEEDTGDSDVDNDEFISQLQFKF